MPTLIPETIQALVEAHFRTRYAERDDAGHLDTHAAEAFVVVGDRGLPLAEADRAEVLAAWAEVPTGSEPSFPSARLERFEAAADRGVAVVHLTEAVTGEAALAVLGLVREADDWRVAWATIAEAAPAALDYDHWRLVALSELASIAMAIASGPMTSLLEVSWARQRWLPRQRFLALPETAFSCRMTGTCCSHELTIGIDENSRRFIEAVDWRSLAPHVGEGPLTEALPEAAHGLVSFRHRLARQPGGRCRFLTADNRCSVHALAGRAVFKPCHVFPYQFAWSPDGVCVTTHHMCPTARAASGAPMATQEPELRRRLAAAELRRPERFMLRPGQEIAWEEFRTIEGQLLSLLEGEAPLKQKLWVALRWLDQRLDDPAAGVDAFWFQLEVPRANLLTRLAFGRFGKLFDACFKDLRGVEPGDGLMPEFEAELTRWMRALLFSKATTYPYGLVAGFNYLALAYHVLERQVARHARRGISEAFWREFYAVVSSGTFLRMLGVFHQTPATGFARYSATPAFGMSVLRL